MKLIAVVLPQIYKGGVLRGVISFLKKIQSKSDNKYKFTFFVLSLEEYQEEINELQEIAIDTKEFTWDLIKQTKRDSYYEYKTTPNIGKEQTDYYLFFTDRIEWPLIINKPYGIVVYDYIQRYVPEIFDGLSLELYSKL